MALAASTRGPPTADPKSSISLEGTAAGGACVVAARVLFDDGASVRCAAARAHAR